MNLSSIAQFLLGVILGISILGVSGAAAGYYFFSKMAVTPSKPVFPEERPQSSEAPATSEAGGQEEEATIPKPTPAELPSGAYRVRVNWPDGLSLRDKPSLDANRLEVIPYEAEMIVLRTTDDGKWDRVRLPGSSNEGWVKAGNSDRIEED
ncbi:MAG: SH3 domain-containing protein [Cyanobacteria bacterium SBLK]|nr:SH3 domain-containing protein [Cyanobacteria bacterium SBLK]